MSILQYNGGAIIAMTGKNCVGICRFSPWFCEPLVAGLSEDGKPFLSGMDLIGAPVFTDDFVVSGTCTANLHGMCEALYEKDMAFRPGNVDLPDAAATSAAIDDPRFFGNVETDFDFPELADTAFAQNMLTQYDELKTARARTIATQRETTQRPDRHAQFDALNGNNRGVPRSPLVGRSPLHASEDEYDYEQDRSGLLDIPGPLPGEEREGEGALGRRSRGSRQLSSIHDSRSSRASDIELMRGEQSRSSLLSQSVSIDRNFRRSSISSGGLLFGADFDELPAMDDMMGVGFDAPPLLDSLLPFDESYEEAAQRMSRATIDDDALPLPLPLQSPQPLSDDTPVLANRGKQARGRDSRMDGGHEFVEDDGGFGYRDDAGPGPEVGAASGALGLVGGEREDAVNDQGGVEAGAAVRRVRRKRQRVVLDDKVELSGKEMKKMMDDRSAILRRQPGEPIPIKAGVLHRPEADVGPEQRLRQPSQRGLCPELQRLFSMTMKTTRLPFPLLLPPLEGDHALEGEVEVDQQPTPTAAPEAEPETAMDTEAVRGAVGSRTSMLPTHAAIGVEEGDMRLSGGFLDEQERDRDAQGMDLLGGVVGGMGFDMDAREPADGQFSPLPPLDADQPPPFPAPEPEEFETDWVEERQQPADAFAAYTLPADGTLAEQWNERTRRVASALRDLLDKQDSVSFAELTAGGNRRAAAACFLEVLQLTTWGRLEVRQSEAFEDIDIKSTPLLAKDFTV